MVSGVVSRVAPPPVERALMVPGVVYPQNKPRRRTKYRLPVDQDIEANDVDFICLTLSQLSRRNKIQVVPSVQMEDILPGSCCDALVHRSVDSRILFAEPV